MALNCSRRPIFPTHIPRDNLVVDGYFMECGICDKHGEGFDWQRHVNRGCENCFDHSSKSKSVENNASPDLKDIVDLLPSDPFGMDLSTTITAITGWLEDLEFDYGGFRRNYVGFSNDDYHLFTDWSLMWKDAFPPSHLKFDDRRNGANPINEYLGESDKRGVLPCYDLGSACNLSNVVSFDKGDTCGGGAGAAASCSGKDEGIPHEALFFALGYLRVKDLLNVERVCRSFRSTVQNDPLLWRSIHIEKPLNEISDDALLQLTRRAQGNLQRLSLLECIRVTDDGLRRVLEANPRLTKLYVPACTRLSIDGIVNMLRALNFNKDRTGIKHLRIGGIYGVSHEHVEELKYLLCADSQMQQNIYKPHFFTRTNLYRLPDENRSIDVQACPRCDNVSLVYDCPAEGCRVKGQGSQECRACSVCILRCIQCGRCINNSEYEETFCLELLCSACFKVHLKCEDEPEDGHLKCEDEPEDGSLEGMTA